MTLSDPFVFAWIALVMAVTYAGLPRLVRLFGARRLAAGLPALSASLIATVALGTTILAMAGLVNAVTVVALHAAWAAGVVVWSHRSFDKAAERLLRVAVHMDGAGAPRRPPRAPRLSRPQSAALLILGATALAVHVLPALSEARLFHPAAYEYAFRVRQLLGGAIGLQLTSPVLGWTAAVATLTTVDVARLVHLLPPLFACLITAAIVWAVRRQTRSLDAGIVAGFVSMLASSGLAAAAPWGVVLPLQHAAIGEQIAALALLVGIASRRCTAPFSLAALTLACAPMLTPDAPAALRLIAVLCPVAFGLGVAAVYSGARLRTLFAEPATAPAFGLFVFMAGVGLEAPRVVSEHDVVTRQALQAVSVADGEPWTIVGGPMPAVRGHRDGRLQGFAAFQACLAASPAPIGCAAAGRRHVFVFVQKRPFHLPDAISEQMGLIVANRWARATPGVRIFHDDETLRVYHLPPAPTGS